MMCACLEWNIRKKRELIPSFPMQAHTTFNVWMSSGLYWFGLLGIGEVITILYNSQIEWPRYKECKGRLWNARKTFIGCVLSRFISSALPPTRLDFRAFTGLPSRRSRSLRKSHMFLCWLCHYDTNVNGTDKKWYSLEDCLKLAAFPQLT